MEVHLSKAIKPSKKPTAIKKEIVAKVKEDGWRIPPSDGIPRYNSEKDPHCTVARSLSY